MPYRFHREEEANDCLSFGSILDVAFRGVASIHGVKVALVDVVKGKHVSAAEFQYLTRATKCSR